VEAPNVYNDKRGSARAVEGVSGGLVVSGRQNTATNGLDAYLAKIANIDGTSAEVWRRTYGDALEQELVSITVLADGGFLLVGTTATASNGKDIFLVRTDADGVEMWRRTYGGTGDETGVSVRAIAASEYLVAGTTTSSGEGSTDLVVYRVKLDCP
jgi:hypothetical protein